MAVVRRHPAWFVLSIMVLSGVAVGYLCQPEMARAQRPSVSGLEQQIEDLELGLLDLGLTVEDTRRHIVPIGTVLDWWRDDVSVAPPDGFVICDGSNEVNAMPIPNLKNRFVRGVTDPNRIGETGGSETHNHPHNHTWAYLNNSGYWYTYRSSGSAAEFEFLKPVLLSGGNYYRAVRSSAEPNTYCYTRSSGPSASHLPPYVGLLKIIRVE